MSLAEQIRNAQGSGGCGTCRWLEQQDEEARAAFTDYVRHANEISEKPYNNKWAPLYEVCRANGLEVGRRAFSDHTNKCLRSPTGMNRDTR